MNAPIVTRFAPSPTGYLHVGGARTALYNWLFARHNGGRMILRIEDTDVVRSTEASTQGIFEALEWLGLAWDEGPFYQSQRLAIYEEHLRRLHRDGLAYPAFESKEELDQMRARAVAEKRNPIYDGASLRLSKDEVASRMAAGREFVWRFRVPVEGYTEVPELLMGGAENRIKNGGIGDFIITRPGTLARPGLPLYNFVCVVDDALMGITHVIRGVEHLTNAARQVLLYRAFGYGLPSFVHLPIIMKNGKKMSKRDTDADGRFPVSVLERRALGYLPEATMNHIALLGWSSPDGNELLSLAQMTETFDLARLSRANPNFDEPKYVYFNSHYIVQKSNADLVELVKPYLIAAGFKIAGLTQNTLENLVAMEKSRCKILSEFPAALEFFFNPPVAYDAKGGQKFFFNPAVDATAILAQGAASLVDVEPFEGPSIDQALAATVERSQVPFKVFGPVLRLALTGKTQSPGLSEMMEALGREESVSRLKRAAAHIAAANV